MGLADGVVNGARVSTVLVLPKGRLVYLANPKTATQSIRAVLRPLSLTVGPFGDLYNRHMPYPTFDKEWRALTEKLLGHPVETLVVVRDPFERLESWFRYRHRNPEGAENSTRGISFDDFARAAALGDQAPVFAKVGDQARFAGWDGLQAGVTHVFDHARLDLLVDFLQRRLACRIRLPQRNISPPAELLGLAPLSEEARAVYRASRPGEFALYAAVARQGSLHRSP